MVAVLSSSVDGHNEAEFGMSWCAGFGGSFYNSYFEVMLFADMWYKGSVIILHHIFSLGRFLSPFVICFYWKVYK